MKIILCAIGLLAIVSCGKKTKIVEVPIDVPAACTIEITETGSSITCGNDSLIIPIPIEESDDQLVEIIDPCGDYIHSDSGNPGNSVDEVILLLKDGTYLAWFKDYGLFVLDYGVQYQTTDKQKCKFFIDLNGNYQEGAI